jgi:hypothetical protein
LDEKATIMTAQKFALWLVVVTAVLTWSTVDAHDQPPTTTANIGTNQTETRDYGATGYEPALMLLFGAGLIALARAARKRNAAP